MHHYGDPIEYRVCQLDRYYDFLVWDGDPTELDENNEDLITYMDAI